MIIGPDDMEDDFGVSRVLVVSVVMPFRGPPMYFDVAPKKGISDDDGGILEVWAWQTIPEADGEDADFALVGAFCLGAKQSLVPDDLEKAFGKRAWFHRNSHHGGNL